MDQNQIEFVYIKKPVNRIGIVSDTHIPTRARNLPRRLFALLKNVQLILHAGDLAEESVLEELRALAPVVAVAGNMDPPHLRRKLGRIKIIRAGAMEIGLVHGDGAHKTTRQRVLAAFQALKPRVVVFGHSHQPLCEEEEGILLFNPGSPVDPRRQPWPSCGRLIVEGESVRGEILVL